MKKIGTFLLLIFIAAMVQHHCGIPIFRIIKSEVHSAISIIRTEILP